MQNDEQNNGCVDELIQKKRYSLKAVSYACSKNLSGHVALNRERY